jgi:hypothetical protein
MRRVILAVSLLCAASAALASDAIFRLSGWAEISSTYRHPGPLTIFDPRSSVARVTVIRESQGASRSRRSPSDKGSLRAATVIAAASASVM